ncbi:uncharacterized protein IL334_002776 [Kwoniella shivajii]|uniref:BHLH domain-containing protein n=1 Tax=Kwoniella shivajii TaxID=564305 RepID=A0ABZ1CYQ2_9TREE|nr:hypothetical protein IL334_002776 [Kwoniella shivajii]
MANLSPISGSPTSFKSNTSPVPISIPFSSNTTNTHTTTKKSKPRKRVNTAEKRSQHNAIERARRETLNGKFLSLAKLLPSLASSRRPSKSAIVNGSISHLTHQRDQRLLAAKVLKDIMAERDELLNELNDWRKLSGYSPKEVQNSYHEEVEQINSVQSEVFGNFAGMGGDGEDNDNDEDDLSNNNQLNESFDTASAVTNMSNSFTSVNGLITPRSSTDLDLALQQNLYNAATTPAIATRPSSASTNGLNWSNEFAFNLNNQMNSNMTFGSTHSSPQNIVSPSSEPSLMYHHTPSPGSSHSVSASSEPISQGHANAMAMPQGWSAQQLAMLQQHAVQANTIMRAHQAQAQTHAHQAQPFNPIVGNSFNAMFQSAQPGLTTPTGLPPLMPNGNVPDTAFTQQVLSSMFPRQGGGGNEVSLEDLQNAVRAGMGVGMGLMTNWTQTQA